MAGTLSSRASGLALEDAAALHPMEYAARMLERFAGAALASGDGVPRLFVDYDDLPNAVEERIAPFFGLTLSDDDRERMRAVAAIDTKADGRTAYRERPSAIAPEIDDLAARYLDEAFERLKRAARAR